MPRAVLDTSVLVSAFVTPKGTVARLLHMPLRARFQLCVSRPLMAEVGRSLLHKRSIRRRLHYDDETVLTYLRWLLEQAEMIEELPDLRVVADDPEDDMIVATAVAARADYLVTGDRRHLLPLARYEATRIVTVRDFFDMLADGSNGSVKK